MIVTELVQLDLLHGYVSYLLPRHEVVVAQRTVVGAFTGDGS